MQLFVYVELYNLETIVSHQPNMKSIIPFLKVPLLNILIPFNYNLSTIFGSPRYVGPPQISIYAKLL